MAKIFIVPEHIVPSNRNVQFYNKYNEHSSITVSNIEEENEVWARILRDSDAVIAKTVKTDQIDEIDYAIALSNQVYQYFAEHVSTNTVGINMIYKYYWNRLVVMSGRDDLVVGRVRFMGNKRVVPSIVSDKHAGRDVKTLVLGMKYGKVGTGRIPDLVQMIFDYITDESKRAENGRLVHKVYEQSMQAGRHYHYRGDKIQAGSRDFEIDTTARQMFQVKRKSIRQKSAKAEDALPIEEKIKKLDVGRLEQVYDYLMCIISQGSQKPCRS